MNDAVSALATNRPALITEGDLAKSYKHVVDKIDELLALAADLPLVIEDDEDQDAIAAVVPKLRGAHKRAEEIREAEKGPFLDAGRVVDAWFNGQKMRLNTLQAQLQGRLDSYARKKAEAARKAQEEAARKAAEEAAKQQAAAAAAQEAGDTNAEAQAREAAAQKPRTRPRKPRRPPRRNRPIWCGRTPRPARRCPPRASGRRRSSTMRPSTSTPCGRTSRRSRSRRPSTAP